MPEFGESVHPILEKLEPFERRKAEGPSDQSEIHSVGGFLRWEGRLWGVRRRLEDWAMETL